MENPCYINENCFPTDVFYNVTLYVPKGMVDKYRSTEYWYRFLHVEDGNPLANTDFLLIYIIDGNTFKICTINEGDKIIHEENPTKEGCTFLYTLNFLCLRVHGCHIAFV